jgi:hypothetical protein
LEVFRFFVRLVDNAGNNSEGVSIANIDTLITKIA